MTTSRRFEGLASLCRDERFQALFISLFFAVGVAGHRYLPRAMSLITPAVLWVFGFLVVILSLKTANFAGTHPRDKYDRAARLPVLIWIVLVYAITFTIEALGTATGAIFGPYDYGTVLGVSLFSVPLVIGFNWVLVVLGAQRAVQRLPWWLSVPIAAGLIVAFDWILEPLAVRLGYWSWYWEGIPPQNYSAWFIIAAFAGFLFRILRIRLVSLLPLFYLIIQVIFFLALRVFVR